MIIAFVPCRLQSSRLPFKGIRDIYGIPAIERCLINTMAIPGVDKVILATSTNEEDDALEKCTLAGKVEVVRGPENDVLERFIPSIEKYRPDHIMRVTGDSPLVSLELGEYIIKEHLSSNKDVTYTTSQVAYGIACEIYKTSAILKLKKILPDTTHSEYLIYYFMNNPRYFELNPIEAPAEFIRPWRLTLDEENDLKLLNMIYHSLKRKYAPVLFKELVSFFHDSPEMALVNINNAVKYKEDKALAIFLKEQTTIKK